MLAFYFFRNTCLLKGFFGLHTYNNPFAALLLKVDKPRLLTFQGVVPLRTIGHLSATKIGLIKVVGASYEYSAMLQVGCLIAAIKYNTAVCF